MKKNGSPKFNFLRVVFAAAVAAALIAPAAYCKKLTVPQIHQQIEAYRVVRGEIEKWDAPLLPTDPLMQYASESNQSQPKELAQPAQFSELREQLSRARYVFLGDVHTTDQAQENAVRVLTTMAQVGNGGPGLTLVIEWVDSRYQSFIDDYLAGKITLEAVRKGVAYDSNWSFPWSHYSVILTTARGLKVRVLAAETDRARHELGARDEAITRTLEAHRAANPEARYLVMYGQNHLLGHEHLTEKLAHLGFEPQLFILQTLKPATYWRTLERVADPEKMAVMKFSERRFYLDAGSPLLADYEYLRYLAQMADDEPRIIELGRKLGIPDSALERCSKKLTERGR